MLGRHRAKPYYLADPHKQQSLMLNKFPVPRKHGWESLCNTVSDIGCCITLAHGAELEGGKDINPEGDVPFTVSAIDTPSVDKNEWTLTIEMSQEAADNGTTFEILTQICLNTGVCDPPVPMDAEIDGRLHTVSVTPPNSYFSRHTYVNWRVKAQIQTVQNQLSKRRLV